MRLYQLRFEEHEVPAIATTALVLRGLEGKPRRALVMQHGAGGNKYSAIGKAVAFAQAGYLVAAIDAQLFHTRWEPGLSEKRLEDRSLRYRRCVVGTAQDHRKLIDYLLSLDEVMGEKVGVVGGSMGAAIVMVLLTLEDRIEAAIPYIGNPNWFRHGDLDDETRAFLAQYSPWEHLERFWPKAVLFLNGEDDDVAKPEAACELVEALKPYYQDAPERVAVKGYPGVGHNLSEDMRQGALDWLARFYPPA